MALVGRCYPGCGCRQDSQTNRRTREAAAARLATSARELRCDVVLRSRRDRAPVKLAVTSRRGVQHGGEAPLHFFGVGVWLARRRSSIARQRRGVGVRGGLSSGAGSQWKRAAQGSGKWTSNYAYCASIFSSSRRPGMWQQLTDEGEERGEMGETLTELRAIRRARWKLLGIPAAIRAAKPLAEPTPPGASGTSEMRDGEPVFLHVSYCSIR